MQRVLVIIPVWLFLVSLLYSQEQTEKQYLPVNQSTLIGVGKVSLFDSYLSPLYYDGTTISLLHERIKGSALFDSKMLMQNQFKKAFICLGRSWWIIACIVDRKQGIYGKRYC